METQQENLNEIERKYNELNNEKHMLIEQNKTQAQQLVTQAGHNQ